MLLPHAISPMENQSLLALTYYYDQMLLQHEIGSSQFFASKNQCLRCLIPLISCSTLLDDLDRTVTFSSELRFASMSKPGRLEPGFVSMDTLSKRRFAKPKRLPRQNHPFRFQRHDHYSFPRRCHSHHVFLQNHQTSYRTACLGDCSR